MPTKIDLSLIERLGLFTGPFEALARVIGDIFALPFQRSNRPKALLRYVRFAICRAVILSFTTRQLAFLSPGTDETYKKVLASQGAKTESISLSDGTQAHWIGDSSADKLLLFFHGGGYAFPAVDGQFELLLKSVDHIKHQGHKIGILFLQYDVASVSPYPRQLQQAALLLEHALNCLKRAPNQIIMVGDSAGANLTLALLSHILHPHPNVPKIELKGNFAGMGLLSPWVSFDTNTTSMRMNELKDVLPVRSLNQWADTFRAGAPSDPYMEPLYAPEGWFKDLPVKKALLIAGGDEVLVDHAAEFGNLLWKTFPSAVVEIVPGESHDELVTESIMKLPPSKQREIFLEWLLETVQSR